VKPFFEIETYSQLSSDMFRRYNHYKSGFLQEINMSIMPGNESVLKELNFGVGTWAWGDKLWWGYGRGYSEEDLRQVFDSSLETGIRLFDTAEVYGQGRSEQFLGEFIRLSGQQVIIATKFMPFPWRLSRSRLIRALKGSLKRLGVDQVDLYQMHQPLPPVNVETWMAAMTEAVQIGLTREVGVSNYDLSWTQRASDALVREGLSLASNQVEYSLINRKIEKNGLLKLCQDLGVRVIAYSPLGMGMLSGKYTRENPPSGIRGRRYNRSLLERMTPLLTLMKRIGSDHAGKTPAQVAINWTICKGTLPIPGAKNLSQAEQNAGALGWELTSDEVAALDEASDRLRE
jgi:aryl-alcohol dehydrogenase-like predicted oxidoreductase